MSNQTEEETEYTEEYFAEKADEFKLLVSQNPCPVRNRRIKELLEEMLKNTELLNMR
jgi:hypothetical protein